MRRAPRVLFRVIVIVAAALAGILLMPGCAARHQVPCPVLVSYSKADDQALIGELNANKSAHPQTSRYLRDYGGLRAQVRICAKGG